MSFVAAFGETTRERLAGFAADTRGNIMVMGVLLLPIVLGIVGFTIDYGKSLGIRSRISGAADSAVLYAVTALAEGKSHDEVTTTANNLMQANLSRLGASLESPTISMAKGETSIVATLTYSASAPASFGAMFGIKAIAVTGLSKAETDLQITPIVALVDPEQVRKMQVVASELSEVRRQLSSLGIQLPETRGELPELSVERPRGSGAQPVRVATSGDTCNPAQTETNLTEVLRGMLATLGVWNLEGSWLGGSQATPSDRVQSCGTRTHIHTGARLVK